MDKQAHEFFKLNARYQVAPGSTANELLNDANCLMSVVRDSLTTLAMTIDVNDGDITNERGFCQLLWGLSYLAEMGNAAASAAHLIVLPSGAGDLHD